MVGVFRFLSHSASHPSSQDDAAPQPDANLGVVSSLPDATPKNNASVAIDIGMVIVFILLPHLDLGTTLPNPNPNPKHLAEP